MSTKSLSPIDGPSAAKTPLTVTTAMCNLDLAARIIKLEEEQKEILNKVSVAKRLAVKCILERVALEQVVQMMEKSLEERGRQHTINLEHVATKWRSEVDNLLHSCRGIEEDKMRETLMHDILSDSVHKLQNLKYGSF
jgi:hypothetical protein